MMIGEFHCPGNTARQTSHDPGDHSPETEAAPKGDLSYLSDWLGEGDTIPHFLKSWSGRATGI